MPCTFPIVTGTGYISKKENQMAVTITEILGTDSISGSRLTINANFLLLENAYNDLEDTFNINVLTGSMDVSAASSGQIKAKTLLSNSLVLPSSGSPTVEIYGTGASAGFVVASSTVAGATGIFSNVLQANTLSVTGAATFAATASFQAQTNINGSLTFGASGSIVNTNRKASVGSTTAFPAPPGAGVTGTYANPYQLSLTENVIYIQSDYVDGGYQGFFFYATTGSGATASDIPAGYTVTLIDTATSAGKIVTGLTGGGSGYYTGFNSTYFSDVPTPGAPYSTSVTLMWEPRIAQNDAQEKGSWVVVSSTPNWTF
jgi:hypothetical protein